MKWYKIFWWEKKEKKKYKCINLLSLQSQVQDLVGGKHKKTQDKASHEWREAFAPGFAAPDPSAGTEAPPEEILPYPYDDI